MPLLLSLFIMSCSSEDDTTLPVDPGVANSVQLRTDATFGKVLTNADGFTLYFFAPDAKGTANCLGGCAEAWPAFFSEDLSLDAGLDASDFGIITRSDGQSQNTYKGWPLYTFANDTQAGDINGDGNGGVWFVGKPDYSIMLVRAQLVGRSSTGTEANLTSAFEPGDEETFYLTDDRGNTLYHFSNDENANNTFTAPDFSNNGAWPIYHTEIENVVSALNTSGFGVIDVFGRSQTTYKGWPLYTFGGDENRGDNYGVGFPQAGVWPILNTDTALAPQGTGGPDIVFEVSNNGASSYVFDFTPDENPDLELVRGNTYEFNVSAPGHPFYINSIQGTGTSNAYNEGVTNNGISNGVITFVVPLNAPNELFYNCEFHGSMTGTITIID